jgi:CRISPR-associated endonuclease/helicase Cas3
MAEEFLDMEHIPKDLVKHIGKQCNVKLDNPEKKLSHENKSFLRHVKECWNTAHALLRELGIDNDETRKLCFSLCVAHDIGKLHPSWQIGKKGVKHATLGGDLLKKIKKGLPRLLPLPDGYDALLIFATMRHHQSLFVQSEITKLENELDELLYSNNKPNISLGVKIADTIGIFKIADILSAQNFPGNKILSQYRWIEGMDTRIMEAIKMKAERKRSFDPVKYKLQREIASSNSTHLVVIAPTGWGKTALALLRVKHMKPKKVFYVLPTITAIREFEKTLREMLGAEYVGEHFYFSDVEYLVLKREEEITYPIDFYRLFIPKVMLTTIDQLLLTMLQFGKYHLRRFNFRNSLIVFDEFHLLTPQMIGSLKAIFENLTNIYNFSVLLMSATPRSLYVDVLGEALKKYGGLEVNVLKKEYNKLSRHDVKLVDDHLLNYVQNNIENLRGKKTLLILNTVDRAIEAYKFLREELKEHKIALIHSRFANKDRLSKEAEAEDAEILTSTQVAEVSLDISYEVLLTELAPVPSLIQRFGRVNRYGTQKKRGNVLIFRQLESEKPYLSIELDATKEVTYMFKELKKRGEKAYLNILTEYYERLTKKDLEQRIEKAYKVIVRKLDNLGYFYPIKVKSTEFSKMFGREPSSLALPAPYYDTVTQLYKKLKKTKLYGERRRVFAQIKEHFMSVPLYIVSGEGVWNDELHIPVVGSKKYEYYPQIGLVKTYS